MKHTLEVIFRKEQVIKMLSNEPFTDEEASLFIKKYKFDTIEEKYAFVKGMNEVLGWSEIFIPEFELLDK